MHKKSQQPKALKAAVRSNWCCGALSPQLRLLCCGFTAAQDNAGQNPQLCLQAALLDPDNVKQLQQLVPKMQQAYANLLSSEAKLEYNGKEVPVGKLRSVEVAEPGSTEQANAVQALVYHLKNLGITRDVGQLGKSMAKWRQWLKQNDGAEKAAASLAA